MMAAEMHSAAHPKRRSLVLGLALPALVIVILPLVPIVPMSFTRTNVVAFLPHEWGLRAYELLFAAPEWQTAFVFSLEAAALAMVFAVVAATGAAVGLSRLNFTGKQIVTAFMLAPLALPVVVLGLADFQFFARLRLNGSLLGIALAHGVVGVPYVFLTVRAALSRLDYSLVRAAASLGAGSLSILRWVYLPAIGPALAAGMMLAFVVSFEEVVVALFLSGPAAITLPVKLFNELQYNLSPVIMAVSTIIFGFVFIAVLAGTVVIEWRQVRANAVPIIRTPR
jgi:putative spermidine/putrescine transport system permease protein